MPSWLSAYYADPITIVSGSNRRVRDADGVEYLDFLGGIASSIVGYGLPEIADAIKAQLDTGIVHTSTLFMSESYVRLAERLSELSGIRDAKVFFTNSGTEANEAAVLLATTARNSNEVLALRNGYHGWSAAEIGLRFGLLVLVIGPVGSVFGGWLADRFEQAGRRDGKFIVGILAGLGVIPSAMLVGLAPGAALAFAGVAPVIFFTSFVWGIAPGALQEIIHGAVLGRVTAIYTAILNLFALGLGPLSVALLAHRLDATLGVAMAIIAPLAGLIAAIAFALGRRSYRARRVELEGVVKP